MTTNFPLRRLSAYFKNFAVSLTWY